MMNETKLTFLEVLKWDEEQCRDFVASMRWPDGVQCPECGSAEEPYRITRKTANKNKLQSLYKCRSCVKQFSATVGTIFEDSHVPLNKWLAALFLMVSSKKGISAHQLYRMLDLGSYRTAWFMAHGVREARRAKGLLRPLSGDVEADETYLHPRRRRGSPSHHERIKDEIEMGLRPASVKKGPYEGKAVIFGMQERDGDVRSAHVPDNSSKTVHPVVHSWVDAPNTRLLTDQSPIYRRAKQSMKHETINHETEYVRGNVHTQNIDNYWSIVKRGVYGVFHHTGEDYLPAYLTEFDFRRNRRKVSDSERFVSLMRQLQGRLIWYCKTPQPQNPYA